MYSVTLKGDFAANCVAVQMQIQARGADLL